jgi:hypothetical protein
MICGVKFYKLLKVSAETVEVVAAYGEESAGESDWQGQVLHKLFTADSG